ncbi:ERF family protein [uncultured Microbacterium sp.]|uniref:ERF family protein n=1 Tax=uncultured Microbacterium sp. TaxID=191216 RepID=UPI0025E8BB2B|nr:ERF family protein [uncultured Microbacterium sp.]
MSPQTSIAEPIESVLQQHVEHVDIYEALAAFQAEIPAVRKESEITIDGDHGPESVMYADLATITERAMPVLGRHGLSFSATPTVIEGGGFLLQYALTHEASGQIAGTFPLPDPFLFDPQDLSAAITRARRLAFCAVTGVAPGGDAIDTPRPAPTAQPWEPARAWVAEVATVADADAYIALWNEAREAVKAKDAPRRTLDDMAAAWRKREGELATENEGEAAA